MDAFHHTPGIVHMANHRQFLPESRGGDFFLYTLLHHLLHGEDVVWCGMLTAYGFQSNVYIYAYKTRSAI